MKYLHFLYFSCMVLFFGCASVVTDPVIDMTPPAYVEEIPPKMPQDNINNPGSLFGNGENYLFSDKTAVGLNDIVTIVIREKTTQSSTASKKLSDSNADSLGGGVFAGSSGESSVIGDAINQANKLTNVGFKTQSNNNFTGTGENLRNENFTTTISARVVKVLKNGNYFIAGSKELLISGEKQIIQVSGVIRPYDINQNNEIDSKYISDAKILYKTEGDMQRSTNKPWGSTILKSIWPF